MITIPIADKAETGTELGITASETAIALLNNNREGFLLLDNVLDWPDSPTNTHEALDSLKQDVKALVEYPYTPTNVLDWTPTPTTVLEALEQLNSDKSARTTEIVTTDVVVTSVVAASVQTAAYVQADVESIAALANDLKSKYDTLVALTNELKATINAMNL